MTPSPSTMPDDATKRFCCILQIDDNPSDLELTQVALDEAEGVSFIYNGVTNPCDGVAALQSGALPIPHVLVLDLNLPRMHGLDVLRQLREDARFSAVRIIVFTTSNAEEDRRRSLALGATAFITKPTDFTQLVAVARTIMSYC